MWAVLGPWIDLPRAEGEGGGWGQETAAPRGAQALGRDPLIVTQAVSPRVGDARCAAS